MKKSANKFKTLSESSPVSGKAGRLIVISAPSGCGKTTIVERLLARNKHLTRSVSYTTRSPRAGEKNGIDYFFISRQAFEDKLKKKFFLEHATLFGEYYGTAKTFVMEKIADHKDCILAIDVQGGKQLIKQSGNDIPVISIFVMPPSLEVLEGRLRKRSTETEEEIRKRLTVAKQEMAERSLYDHVVVNEEVENAVRKIEEILK